MRSLMVVEVKRGVLGRGARPLPKLGTVDQIEQLCPWGEAYLDRDLGDEPVHGNEFHERDLIHV